MRDIAKVRPPRCAFSQYIYKGADRASVHATGEWNRDEVAMFEDMRYFGAAEACWRLLSFNLFERQPPVKRLAMHLDGQEMVNFNTGGERAAGVADAPPSQLKAWLHFCASPPEGLTLPNGVDWLSMTYVQFPGHFTYVNHEWRPYVNHPGRYRPVGRLDAVSLRGDEERFYLRLLLTHVTCREVRQLVSARGANEPVRVALLRGACPTFKDACIERGLAGTATANGNMRWQRRVSHTHHTSCESSSCG